MTTANLSESERKKALNKLKKAEAKAKAAKEAEPKKPADTKKAAAAKPNEEDTDGLKLLQTKTPLEDALKFILPLQTQMPANAEAHLLAAEVHLRRGNGGICALPMNANVRSTLRRRPTPLCAGKPLLVLRALTRAQALQPSSPHLHRLLCKLAQHGLPAAAGAPARPAAVQAVITHTLAALTKGHTAQALNDAFLAQHGGSLLHVIAGAVPRAHTRRRASSRACSPRRSRETHRNTPSGGDDAGPGRGQGQGGCPPRGCAADRGRLVRASQGAVRCGMRVGERAPAAHTRIGRPGFQACTQVHHLLAHGCGDAAAATAFAARARQVLPLAPLFQAPAKA